MRVWLAFVFVGLVAEFCFGSYCEVDKRAREYFVTSYNPVIFCFTSLPQRTDECFKGSGLHRPKFELYPCETNYGILGEFHDT